MKKISLTIISLAVIAFLTTTAFSTVKNNPLSRHTDGDPGVVYVVEVNTDNANGYCHSYFVVITDEFGVPVTEPVEYHTEKPTYVFHEKTPACVTRIAMLMEADELESHYCSQKSYAVPDEISTTFRKGATYKFNLKLVPVPGDD